jgi:NADPH:quinone reductase-like Zn-dependent oxidoreductase
MARNLYGVRKIAGTTRKEEKIERMKKCGYDVVIVLSPQRVGSLSAGDLSGFVKSAGEEPSGFTAQLDLIGATNIPLSLACAKSPGGSRVCQAGMLAGSYHFPEATPFSPMSIVSCDYKLNFK